VWGDTVMVSQSNHQGDSGGVMVSLSPFDWLRVTVVVSW
jgi:hypothetical protein